MPKYKPQHKIKIEWSSKFAYAIGLITSDGYLYKDGSHIKFTSKDLELIKKFKKSLSLKNKTGKYDRGGKIEKRFFNVVFGDKIFYRFLNRIGLESAKSKTIKSVRVPDMFFADFLRGVFDGDGTFYSYRDRRWPNSFVFRMSFASASFDFIYWIKSRLTQLYYVKGIIKRGSGVFNLDYVKGDTKKLFNAMYHTNNLLFFSKKYLKVKTALDKDKKIGLAYLQKHRIAGLAHR